MRKEILVTHSREVPKGACVVGRDKGVEGKVIYDPIYMSDCQSSDLFLDGVVRNEVEKGNKVVVIFNSEDEMVENYEHIANAFGDLLENDE